MKYSDIENMMGGGAVAKQLRDMEAHKRTIEELAGGGYAAKQLRDMEAHKRTIEELVGGGYAAKQLRDMEAHKRTIEELAGGGYAAKQLRDMEAHKRTIEELVGGGYAAKQLRDMGAHRRTIEELVGGGYAAKILRSMETQKRNIESITGMSRATEFIRSMETQKRTIESITGMTRATEFARVMEMQSITRRAVERLTKDSGFFEVEAVNDNVISIDGETVDLAEIDQKVGEILNKSTATVDLFDDIFLWLDGLSKTLKHIATHYIFINLIIPLVYLYVAINHPSILCFSPECNREEPRIVIKQVINETNDDFSREDLNSYRVVTAPSGLNVRSIGNTKGERIGGLQVGVRVMLVLKAKDWSLVEYYDQEKDEYHQGWVFSRHLKKFN